jgi:IS5 family transposase
LVRELERRLTPQSKYQKDLELFFQVLMQQKDSKKKIYSLDEPAVVCISKGKEHKKYEFGNKVSIAKTDSGVIVGALSFRDKFDGITYHPIF